MADGWSWTLAVLAIVVAGLCSAADGALSTFSRARADELLAEGHTGARRVLRILDDPARYLNTVLLLRLMGEVSASVLVSLSLYDYFGGDYLRTVSSALGVMLLVSFVLIGVAPRTLGRQHDTTVALWSAPVVIGLTRVLGPLPQLLILLGNAITPGRGFRHGPFASETELRELVDLAEASAVIEEGERKMIHSVFELGDTVTREVMVPRTEVVWIERHKNLRQARSLFLRSGYSRIPVVGENLDDPVGVLYLKDVVRRDFEHPEAETVERVEQLMRETYFVPDSKPVDDLLAQMQARRQHVALVVDEYGGTAGLVTIEDVLEEIVGEITDEYDPAAVVPEPVEDGFRVSTRYPIDDLVDLFDVNVLDDDVDTVAGLMAKHLGRVPIPGSVVQAHGLRFEAEGPAGRRNRIAAVLVTPIAAVSAPEPVAEPVLPGADDD